MKKIIFILLLFAFFQSEAQVNRFPSIDSAKRYTLRYIRNSTMEAFTNFRLQNVAYGTLELIDSLAGAGVIDSIWKTSGGGVDTLKYRVSGLTVVVGTFSGGGGSSYTFANGLTESAGAVKLGGALTESTHIWNNKFKHSYKNTSTDSVSIFTDTYFGDPALFIRRKGTGIDNYLQLGKDVFFRVGEDFSNELGFDFFNDGAGNLTATFYDNRAAGAKGIEYNFTDTSSLTNQSLITKGYLGQRLSSLPSGSTSLNNVGTGFDLAQQGTDNVKRLQAGFGIKLDSTTTANTVRVSVDTTTQTLTDGATITFDANSGVSAQVTLGGNRTLAFSNFSAGVYLTLVVIQDGTGSRTLTLPAGTKVINGGAGAVTLTTAAASEDILTFFKIGTTIYCNYGKNYN